MSAWAISQDGSAMSKFVKALVTEELRSRYADVTSACVVDLTGLDVAAQEKLRRTLRAKTARLEVLKNSLARRAFAGGPLDSLGKALDGPCALVTSRESLIEVARLLIEAAKGKDIDPQSRRQSIRALGRIKDDEVIAFLEDLFKKESGMIKLNAAYALCKEGNSQYESYFKEALQDENLFDSASSLLVDLKGEEAIPIIEEALKDRSDVEKKAMRSYLEQMVRESKAHK